jgi:hypothetical protein
MDKHQVKGQRLGALSMLGLLLFNNPLLALFSDHGFVFGIPVLYAYIFVSWGLLILLIALVIETD